MIFAGLQLDIAWERPAENFHRAEALVREAVDRGARVLVLPELFATGFSMRSEAMAVHAAEVRTFLAGTAVEHDVWMIGGYAEPGLERPANACGIFAPNGDEVLHYRKIHPFSLASEPEHYEAGLDLCTLEIEGVRVTPIICYDLRFPELYRQLVEGGARWFTVPSAFAPATGKDHWEVLLRARAIENQVFVIAPAQCGQHTPDRSSYGRSLIIDPWGLVLAQGTDQPGVLVADCDLSNLARIRSATLPCS
jgi:predicted amidohydrolase